ncbi:MAG: aldolase/citrate lyase family protein [Bryobacteraceae bacterium]
MHFPPSRIALGIFCELPTPASVEIIAAAGWDFVIIDCEHAPITAQMLPDFIRASDAARIPAIVRVPENNAAAIQHALDAGASGVQIPQISSVEAARAAVSAARFHPTGQRGFNPFVRAARYSAEAVPDFLKRSNNDITVVLQIESSEGVRVVDHILEIPGIDVLFIGPYDLSQSLGIPGHTSDPRVYAAGQEIVAKAARHKVRVGVFTNSDVEAQRWKEIGIQYLCYSVDTVLLLHALRVAHQRVRES